MPTGQLASALRGLRALFATGTSAGLTDRQLLERFAARRAASAEAATAAEAAFAALMDRHGAMVWGVCRRVLGDTHEAEDAFQATFLVLVRKAGSVQVDDSLGRWLYGVAQRVAHRARSEARRRDRRELVPAAVADDPARQAEREDLRGALGEELDRLPTRYRGPIELCDLQGLSYDQAARQLDWPSTTVKSRLARGRLRLRERLVRRGLAPAAAATAALARDARAAVPPGLIRSTIRAATSRAAGAFPAAVVALGQGVLTMIRWQKIKLVAAGALAVVGLVEVAQYSRALPVPLAADEPPRRAGERAKTPAADRERVIRLIPDLRVANVDEMEAWATAIRDLVAIGRPAVPPLIEELDKTTDPMMLRSLGFALRALGDPRAVPALIRAIPRTLVPSGSDYGLKMNNANLLAFLQKHDLDKGDGGPLFSFGMPFREITGALRSLTGRRFDEDELNFVSLEGGAAQRRLKLGLFQRLAAQWAGWWEGDWRRFTDDPAYSRVNLPPPPPEMPEAVPSPVQPFPTGSKVKATNGWAGAIVGPPQALDYYRTFNDLDTGRDLKWPDALGRPEAVKDDSVADWASRKGYDLQGVEFRPPGSDRSYYAIRGLGLRAWQIDDKLYGAIEGQLAAGRVPALDRPVVDLLMDFDPATKTYRPENKATFLFVTREGATGALQVDGQVTRLHGDRAATDPEGLRGFYRGVQFGYKLLFDESDIPREKP